MIVDVHAHHYPRALLDLAGRAIDEDLARTVEKRAPGAAMSEREHVDQLDRAGIDLQLISPAPFFPAGDDADRATAVAREVNEIYAARVRAQPSRFRGLGVVPLPHADAAVAEAARCLEDPGMVGIAVGCSVAGRQLDDPAFEPLWDELDRRGAILFVHPVGLADEWLRDYNLNWVVGPAFEETVAALRLVLSGVTTRHSGMRVIVAHLGGAVPFLMTRIERATGVVARSDQTAIDGSVGEHLRRLHYDTSSRNPDALRCAAAVLGPDALVLGTDFPFSLGEDLRENVSYVEATLPERPALAGILGDNAARLIGAA